MSYLDEAKADAIRTLTMLSALNRAVGVASGKDSDTALADELESLALAVESLADGKLADLPSPVEKLSRVVQTDWERKEYGYAAAAVDTLKNRYILTRDPAEQFLKRRLAAISRRIIVIIMNIDATGHFY